MIASSRVPQRAIPNIARVVALLSHSISILFSPFPSHLSAFPAFSSCLCARPVSHEPSITQSPLIRSPPVFSTRCNHRFRSPLSPTAPPVDESVEQRSRLLISGVSCLPSVYTLRIVLQFAYFSFFPLDVSAIGWSVQSHLHYVLYPDFTRQLSPR